MRRLATIAAAICLAIGLVWLAGGWLLEWIGRITGARGITSSYESFVKGFVSSLMIDGSIAMIIGPWLMVAAGVVALVLLHRAGRSPGSH